MTTLTEQLTAAREKAREGAPTEAIAIMDKATQDLKNSAIETQVIKVGAIVPNFELPNHDGKVIKLTELLKIGPVVLTFYRGGWCPYCNLELRSLQSRLPDFIELGAQLVAITPEQPDHSMSTIERNDIAFPVLTDDHNLFAKKLGLVFTLPEDIRDIYTQFGLDVAAHNGNEDFELPLPGTFVIDQDQKVKYAFAKADYTNRADPNDILEALK